MGKKRRGCNLRFLRVAPRLRVPAKECQWVLKRQLPARCGLQTDFVPQAPSGGQLMVALGEFSIQRRFKQGASERVLLPLPLAGEGGGEGASMPTGLGQYPLLLKALRMGAFCLSGSPSPLPPDPVRGRLSPASGRGSKAKPPARRALQAIFMPQAPSGGRFSFCPCQAHHRRVAPIWLEL